MVHRLKNGSVEIAVREEGAELISVKDGSGKEYLWQGDKKYWGRQSPVLFPFVGRLKDCKFLYEGKYYQAEPHGFAKDMKFKVVRKAETEILLETGSTEETLRVYPFEFVLRIGYKLVNNAVEVLWEVENRSSSKTMYFNIGAHPGFNCPIEGEEDKVGYFLEYNSEGNPVYYSADIVTGLRFNETAELTLEEGRSVIGDGYFDKTTYIFEDRQISEASILTPSGRKYVSVKFDMPVLAVWSPEKKNAPFICIEPWYGRGDREDFEGELSEREFNNVLGAGETFKNKYSIEIFSK